MKHIYLSYFLDENTPLYGGEKGIEIVPDRDIGNGDTANTKRLKLHNHSGTHIDFPNHFFADGKMSHHYEADFWIFNHPFLLEHEALKNELIFPPEQSIKSIPLETDFLIIKTGFGKYRDKEAYWKYNAGLHPDLAGMIRQHIPNVRVIGVDLVSITSFQDRPSGRVAHKHFLGGEPILLIEDMKLDALVGSPLRVVCLPLLAKGLDGAPITIIAEIS